MVKVTLRAPNAEDAAIHFAHPPEAEIVRMYGGDPHHLREASMEWSENWLKWLEEHRFGRIILADGQPVGEIRLHSFNDDARTAKLALGLFSTRYINRGIGREAIRQTLRIAFEEYNLTRVDLRVLAFNERAIRCYKACGFQHVATESIDIMGTPTDEWVMSCAAGD